MLEQVLINLIKNAIQALNECEEKADRYIILLAKQDEKNRPMISVKDNAGGIETEALEKIFIPFYTTKKSGSGIGLSLSRQIMRQHRLPRKLPQNLKHPASLGPLALEFLCRFPAEP